MVVSTNRFWLNPLISICTINDLSLSGRDPPCAKPVSDPSSQSLQADNISSDLPISLTVQPQCIYFKGGMLSYIALQRFARNVSSCKH